MSDAYRLNRKYPHRGGFVRLTDSVQALAVYKVLLCSYGIQDSHNSQYTSLNLQVSWLYAELQPEELTVAVVKTYEKSVCHW